MRRHTATVFAIFALACLAAGCAESKIIQCNRIVQVTNQAVSKTKEITNSGQNTDPKSMLAASKAMTKAAEEMAAIEVADENLKTIQASFADWYRAASKNTANVAAALDRQDRKAFESALVDFRQSSESEEKLVNKINTYCAEDIPEE